MTAYRPSARSWALLTWTEAKLVVRDTPGLVIPLGLPMLIMVMNGLGSDGRGDGKFRGLPALDAYVVPLTMVMVVAIIGTVNMPAVLASYRKEGVLRRLGVTPAHPAMLLIAQVLASLVQVLAGVALSLLVARLAFDVSMPRGAFTAAGVFCLVTLAMYALGMVVAAIAPSTNAAMAIGLVVFFLMMAVGGGFGARENLPDGLAAFGGYLPFGAGVEAMSDAWMGVAPDPSQLAVLAAVIVLAGGAAAKLFRWS
ncbi:ABC transporter permease [Actinomadura sp. 7K507]|uniref:ABC transporter permease n=1 Tax=Actinomadura sp. 7K507 TaxID=2530365 RepID=UPI00104B4DD8|nr:ABC transporter permease [Actinomadura sp. 7K507]TDC96581.1 ABC transporter permease [Actinomadura sp. 7K507]